MKNKFFTEKGVKKITKAYFTIKGFFIRLKMKKGEYHKKKKPINFGRLVC